MLRCHPWKRRRRGSDICKMGFNKITLRLEQTSLTTCIPSHSTTDATSFSSTGGSFLLCFFGNVLWAVEAPTPFGFIVSSPEEILFFLLVTIVAIPPRHKGRKRACGPKLWLWLSRPYHAATLNMVSARDAPVQHIPLALLVKLKNRVTTASAAVLSCRNKLIFV
jgi:hypothetical protein